MFIAYETIQITCPLLYIQVTLLYAVNFYIYLTTLP